MQPLHILQMVRQRLHHQRRQRHRPVLAALARSNHDLTSGQVNVLHSQIQTLAQPKPTTIQQHGNQPRHSVQMIQYPRDLLSRQHDRHVSPLLRPGDTRQGRQRPLEHLPIQEQERAERLVLRRGRHVQMLSKITQERPYLWRAEVPGMALAMEHDVTPDPTDVALFGPRAEVPQANR